MVHFVSLELIIILNIECIIIFINQHEQELEILLFQTNYCRSVSLSVLDDGYTYVNRSQKYYMLEHAGNGIFGILSSK